jgi:hypothetical protein
MYELRPELRSAAREKPRDGAALRQLSISKMTN